MNLNKIELSIAQILKDAGYQVVRIKTDKNNLEIMIERTNGNSVAIRDCSIATKIITPVLFDLLGDGVFLEVSSPGINRPLVKVEDYAKYSGHMVSIVFENTSESGVQKNVKCTGSLKFEGNNDEYQITITDSKNLDKIYQIKLEQVVSCELFIDKNNLNEGIINQ